MLRFSGVDARETHRQNDCVTSKNRPAKDGPDDDLLCAEIARRKQDQADRERIPQLPPRRGEARAGTGPLIDEAGHPIEHSSHGAGVLADAHRARNRLRHRRAPPPPCGRLTGARAASLDRGSERPIELSTLPFGERTLPLGGRDPSLIREGAASAVRRDCMSDVSDTLTGRFRRKDHRETQHFRSANCSSRVQLVP
jgi:hypothetical protein